MTPQPRRAGFVLLPVVLLLSLVATAAFLGQRETGLASAVARGATDRDKAVYTAEAGLQRAISHMHTKGCSGSYPLYFFSALQDMSFDGGRYYAYANRSSGSPVTISSIGTYDDAQVTLTREDVPMHQASATTMTLQPAAEGIDTYVKDSGSMNYGSATTLLATAGTTYPMSRFDLAAIPAGAHVTSATLSAYASSGSGSGAVAAHRVMRDWTEAATWTSSDGTTAWTQAGGDVNSQALASATFTAAGNWLAWDLTSMVDKWVKGSLPNQGVQLRAAAGVTGLQIASSDSASASQRPKLAVTFLPPCGWTSPDTTLTLGPTADVDVNFDIPTTNFGAEPDLYVSKKIEARALLQFDVSGVAAGKLVKSAMLRLYFTRVTDDGDAATQTSDAAQLNVHALTKSWKELEATWRRRIIGGNWTTQGGDYRSTAVTTTTVADNTTPGRWVEFQVKTVVQEWVDGVTVNNGLIVILPGSSDDELIFNSRQAATNPPQLVVTYQ